MAFVPTNRSHYVYIAGGTAPDGQRITKIGFSANPGRRYKRFPKHYGLDVHFEEKASYGLPSRALAYAVEQIAIHHCKVRGYENLFGEVFVVDWIDVELIVERVLEAL